MIRQIQFSDLESRDEITLYARKSSVSDVKYAELSVWDDYEGRGGSATIYNVEELDRLIAALFEIRKDILC